MSLGVGYVSSNHVASDNRRLIRKQSTAPVAAQRYQQYGTRDYTDDQLNQHYVRVLQPAVSMILTPSSNSYVINTIRGPQQHQ